MGAGSGIPEIKCYLNGVKVRKLNVMYSDFTCMKIK